MPPNYWDWVQYSNHSNNKTTNGLLSQQVWQMPWAHQYRKHGDSPWEIIYLFEFRKMFLWKGTTNVHSYKEWCDYKKHSQNSVCKIYNTLYWRNINTELSLQSASHNSREIIQQQNWSQIRKICNLLMLSMLKQNHLFSFLILSVFCGKGIETSLQVACFNAGITC